MSVKTLLALLEDRPLLRKKDVAVHFGVTLRTVERWVTEGRLPRPVYIHGPMWRPIDIERLEKGGKHDDQVTK